MTDTTKEPTQPCGETLDDVDDATEVDESAADYNAEEVAE